MSEIEISKISSRGQIVIPKVIRDRIGLTEGDHVAMYSEGDTIYIKKMEMLDLKTRFENTAKEMEKIASANGYTENDVLEAVKNDRKKKKDLC